MTREITLERVEAAMAYLAETDEPVAHAKAERERSEIARKRARARVFLTGAGTVAERQAQAETADDVLAADDAYIAAVTTYEAMTAKRERAALVIDVYRTLEASRRKGS